MFVKHQENIQKALNNLRGAAIDYSGDIPSLERVTGLSNGDLANGYHPEHEGFTTEALGALITEVYNLRPFIHHGEKKSISEYIGGEPGEFIVLALQCATYLLQRYPHASSMILRALVECELKRVLQQRTLRTNIFVTSILNTLTRINVSELPNTNYFDLPVPRHIDEPLDRTYRSWVAVYEKELFKQLSGPIRPTPYDAKKDSHPNITTIRTPYDRLRVFSKVMDEEPITLDKLTNRVTSIVKHINQQWLHISTPDNRGLIVVIQPRDYMTAGWFSELWRPFDPETVSGTRTDKYVIEVYRIGDEVDDVVYHHYKETMLKLVNET